MHCDGLSWRRWPELDVSWQPIRDGSSCHVMTACHDSNLTCHDEPLGCHHNTSKMTACLVWSVHNGQPLAWHAAMCSCVHGNLDPPLLSLTIALAVALTLPSPSLSQSPSPSPLPSPFPLLSPPQQSGGLLPAAQAGVEAHWLWQMNATGLAWSIDMPMSIFF